VLVEWVLQSISADEGCCSPLIVADVVSVRSFQTKRAHAELIVYASARQIHVLNASERNCVGPSSKVNGRMNKVVTFQHL
jgi:CO dehydrogenase/acetyl-CoA synthase alpha subunit